MNLKALWLFQNLRPIRVQISLSSCSFHHLYDPWPPSTDLKRPSCNPKQSSVKKPEICKTSVHNFPRWRSFTCCLWICLKKCWFRTPLSIGIHEADLFDWPDGLIPDNAANSRAGIQDRGRHKYASRPEHSADFGNLHTHSWITLLRVLLCLGQKHTSWRLSLLFKINTTTLKLSFLDVCMDAVGQVSSQREGHTARDAFGQQCMAAPANAVLWLRNVKG